MTTKDYNIFLEGKDLHECYSEFFQTYRDYIKKIGDVHTFDYKNTAIILFTNFKNHLELNRERNVGVNNLELIGNEINIKKVVKDIKSKGFTLEEIAEKN